MRGSRSDNLSAARVVVREADGKTYVEAHGNWLVDTIGAVYSVMCKIEEETAPGDIIIDVRNLGQVDTSGAYLLGRVTRRCGAPDGDFHFVGVHAVARDLIAEVRERTSACSPVETSTFGFLKAMSRIGAGLEAMLFELIGTLGFFGKTLTTGLATFAQPWRFRLTSTIWAMEEVGVNAMPIVATLSFFIGAVIALMGANLLETLGVTVFMVDLVGLSVLREFAVLITAIMLAARSDSAFTASIGSMKMQQEIDAMRVMGLDPYEALVLPRVVACVLMAPLLTFGAMLSGLFGGMLVAWTAQEITPAVFISRLYTEVPIDHFWVGLSKAPVFGLVVAIIGCRQGMEVQNNVESLGRRVTASVVQSIFTVIVIEAAFALLYMELGI